MRLKKGEVWISAILYSLIATVALVLILQAGIPILEKMKDKATFSKTKDVMQNLDKEIQQVASEGEGAQRVVDIEIKEGTMRIDDNQIVWEYETKNKIIDPRTSEKVGNLVITSNANVKTIETDKFYIMTTRIKNDNFTVVINKTGSEGRWVYYDTSMLVNEISFNGISMNGTFKFGINGNPYSEKGTGYTYMEPSGNNTNLGRAKVVSHMNSTIGEYDIEFSLESYADFISVRLKNFVPK